MSYKRRSENEKTKGKENLQTDTTSEKTEKPDYNCGKCKDPDNNEMVRCDRCKTWYHHKCVGTVEEEVRNALWICPVCREKGSRTSGTHRTRSSRLSDTTQITLTTLKEMETSEIKILQETINMKYAEKRLKAIQNDRSTSAGSSVANSSVIQSRTNDWVQKQQQLDLAGNNEMLQTVIHTTRPNNVQAHYNLQSRQIQNVHSTPHPCFEQQRFENINQNQPLKNFANPHLIKMCPSNGGGQIELNPELSRSQRYARQGLEKIELPTFDGNVSEWPLFITTFKLSTERCGYTQVENMVRLKKALKGRAFQAVKGRLLFPNQVPTVIERLTELFGRPVKIIAELISNIRKLPRIGEDDMNGILEMSFEVDNLCGVVEATEVTEYYHHSELLQLLVEKLPGHLRMSWSTFSETTQDPSLLAFRNWLNGVSVRAGRVSNTYDKINKVEKSRAMTSSKFNVGHHEGLTNQTQQKERITENNLCKICEKAEHVVSDCQQFKSLSKKERWDLVVTKKLCGKCLKAHNWKHCHNSKPCGIDGCCKKHHPLLHKQNVENSGNTNHHSQGAQSDTREVDHLVHEVIESDTIQTSKNEINIHNAKHQIYYRIIPVIVYGPDKSVHTYAFLDEGSSITMMENSLADSLNLTGRNSDLCLKWTGSISRVERNSRCVSVSISGAHKDDPTYAMKNVRTVDELNLPIQSVELKISDAHNRHMKHIPLTTYTNVKPSLLIGTDNAQIIVPRETRTGLWDEPIAVRCKLGWTIYGKSTFNEFQGVNFHDCGCSGSNTLQDMMKDYFSLESFGITSSPKLQSDEDKRAIQILENTTKCQEDRYTTSLLWRKDSFQLPESRKGALRRLLCFEKKLSKDDALLKFMSESIKSYLEKGYIRKLLDFELNNGPKTWYLPIFIVSNPSKKKHRIVWDAAYVSNGVSLNSELLTGPDQLSSLIFVLYNFRSRKYGVTADIKEMFHQIRVEHSDQDAQRFLWRDCNQNKLPDEYVMQVCTFGAKCSPSIAQFIKNHNAQKYKNEYPRACQAILEYHYVDDYLDSFNTETEATEISSKVRDIHLKGGFVLRNWISNSKRVQNEMKNETIPETLKHIGDKNDLVQRVLGTQWDTLSDTFTFIVNFDKITEALLSDESRPTKRIVLRTLMSTFDPLGLITPYLVEGKILMQDVWRSAIEWDTYVSDNNFDTWKSWMISLETLSNLRIPRCYTTETNVSDRQLHVFVDSSENMYGAVVYMRTECINGVQITLVGSKCKVAPLKPQSIPRLELLAAVLGVRLTSSIVKGHSNMRFSNITLWSDSRTVLSWLTLDPKRLKQFVALRVAEILESTERNQWRWISTKDNVADYLTKKRHLDDEFRTRWINGPKFLAHDPAEWKQPIKPSEQTVVIEELRVMVQTESESGLKSVTPNPSAFSSWKKLLRSQGYVHRAAKLWIAKMRQENYEAGPLRKTENDSAEITLIKLAQNEMYKDEIDTLKSGNTLQKCGPITQFSPFLDQHGILRMQGRTVYASVPYEAKFPIILPKAHKITTLIVADYHERFRHKNHETTINELRQKFVIPQIRRVLQLVRKQCQLCKNRNAVAVTPMMAPLPESRLNANNPPFSNVGIDCFGPMEVAIGRRIEKRWGLIFTCMVIRAIHIELLPSLSTDSFLMALKRFIARRGCPQKILSDNGTNFRGASKELQAEIKNINKERIQEEFANIIFKFNVPEAPHHGGAWERLIALVKSNLTEMLKTKRPSEELLYTILVECENIVNTRPLTHVPVDEKDEEPITPNHFLTGSSSGRRNLADIDDANDGVKLKRHWRIAEQASREFWKKWLRDYLPIITRRTKWFSQMKNIEIGDVVVICDPKNPTKMWPRAIVIDTNKGKDGNVRSAVIRTSTGIYTRPTVKLALLDVQTTLSDKPTQPEKTYGVEDVDDTTLHN